MNPMTEIRLNLVTFVCLVYLRPIEGNQRGQGRYNDVPRLEWRDTGLERRERPGGGTRTRGTKGSRQRCEYRLFPNTP